MTQRQLVLIRHAKAEAGAPDQGRRLTPRGVRDARALGCWLALQRVAPDVVIVSPATRASQTWEGAAKELPVAPPVDTDDRIYANTMRDLLDAIRDTTPSVGTLAIVGHNPSMQDLACHLAGDGVEPAAAELGQKFPTCAVALFTVEGDWAGISPSTTSLSGFEVPRGDG